VPRIDSMLDEETFMKSSASWRSAFKVSAVVLMNIQVRRAYYCLSMLNTLHQKPIATFAQLSRAAGYIAALLLFASTFAGCRSAISHGDAQLPNFDMVNQTLYRGGQPTQEGFARLHDMGVKTVVNVRQGDTDEGLIDGMSFRYDLRGMSALAPSDEDVIWFLKIATNPASAPVFLHCHYGADRTGYLIAMYRIVVEGWDKERAIVEMTDGGHGFWSVYQNLPAYVRNADIAALRTAVLGAAEAPVLASNQPSQPTQAQ
jgi:protein tyrosine phosphatase (PTP) superfamily phosphohydrolase (DUF442 family)